MAASMILPMRTLRLLHEKLPWLMAATAGLAVLFVYLILLAGLWVWFILQSSLLWILGRFK